MSAKSTVYKREPLKAYVAVGKVSELGEAVANAFKDDVKDEQEADTERCQQLHHRVYPAQLV
jgi:hypothetical protein